ncbi:hypothetical protein HC256_006592 [Beauveria bassiana]|nr:hypothetical protein HC256_006592 [Beauveria bassiana]
MDCDSGPKGEHQLQVDSIINHLLKTYPVISVDELHGQDTHERTYLDLRIIVTAIAQLSLKGQAVNRAKDSYPRLCFWKARDYDLSIERSVPRIQVLSLILLFEQGRGLSDSSTRDALHRACQVMLKIKFSSSLTADEWHNPGLFNVWIVLSAAILLLKYGLDSYIATYLIQRSETDKEVAILERYFDLPYPPADQLEQRFGNIGTATQYTQRVQSMHERYLPLQVESRQGAALRASEPRPLRPI